MKFLIITRISFIYQQYISVMNYPLREVKKIYRWIVLNRYSKHEPKSHYYGDRKCQFITLCNVRFVRVGILSKVSKNTSEFHNNNIMKIGRSESVRQRMHLLPIPLLHFCNSESFTMKMATIQHENLLSRWNH